MWPHGTVLMLTIIAFTKDRAQSILLEDGFMPQETGSG